MEGLLGITYRCNAHCVMCNTWKFPTKKEEEIEAKYFEKLPMLKFANITGGEPFLREDLEEIVDIVKKKAKRIVISTNGYFTEKIVNFAKKHKDIGIRISLEGLPQTNDSLRGVKDGFDHGLRTLLELKSLGLKDIGFGITVSDKNAKDLIQLYHLACWLKVEFATAVVHNTYYFHKMDNQIENKELVIDEFRKLIKEFLKSSRPKDWFRAYFNYGLINYIEGKGRLLPCGAGTDLFYLDPFGEVRPCNGMEESFGNIKEKDFAQIWNGERAEQIRQKVKKCSKNCWMIGSVSPAMKKEILKPGIWVVKNKWLKRT